MKILIKFASRSRPYKFFNCIKNINDHQVSNNLTILCSLDEDDQSMNTPEIKDWFARYRKNGIISCYGKSKNKIDAINRDMHQAPEWDILINFSDDMLFVKKGFDQVIMNDMVSNFPDLDGVLHYHDGHKYGAQLMTMSIMGKKYYDRFNYIYHPDYISLWSDNEAMDVAKMLARYKYMGDGNIIFNHNHPMHQGMGQMNYDAQLRHTESFFQQDKLTYLKRKARQFDLHEVVDLKSNQS